MKRNTAARFIRAGIMKSVFDKKIRGSLYSLKGMPSRRENTLSAVLCEAAWPRRDITER